MLDAGRLQAPGCRLGRGWMLGGSVSATDFFPPPLISVVGKADPPTSTSSCPAASESS